MNHAFPHILALYGTVASLGFGLFFYIIRYNKLIKENEAEKVNLQRDVKDNTRRIEKIESEQHEFQDCLNAIKLAVTEMRTEQKHHTELLERLDKRVNE